MPKHDNDPHGDLITLLEKVETLIILMIACTMALIAIDLLGVP